MTGLYPCIWSSLDSYLGKFGTQNSSKLSLLHSTMFHKLSTDYDGVANKYAIDCKEVDDLPLNRKMDIEYNGHL